MIAPHDARPDLRYEVANDRPEELALPVGAFGHEDVGDKGTIPAKDDRRQAAVPALGIGPARKHGGAR